MNKKIQEIRSKALSLQIESVIEEDDGSYTVETSLSVGQNYVSLSNVEDILTSPSGINTDDQYKLSQKIAKELGIGIVTCGSCGGVILVKLETEYITCHHCSKELNHSDCPDLFCSDWEINLSKHGENHE